MTSRWIFLTLLLVPFFAIPATAQTKGLSEITMLAPAPKLVTTACSALATEQDHALGAMLEASVMERSEARVVFQTLADSLSRVALAAPEDVELQFMLAAVVGSLADVEKGRGRIRAAQQLHEQVQAVLVLDPGHPGAQHLLGRLHAAVMRMDRITRFLATRVLGGSELRGASWEEARLRLEAAAAGDPCSMDHHYELAKLYAERGEPRLALRPLRQLLRLQASSARERVIQNRALLLLTELRSTG